MKDKYLGWSESNIIVDLKNQIVDLNIEKSNHIKSIGDSGILAIDQYIESVELRKEIADLKEENKDLVAEADQLCRSIFLLEQEITLNHRTKPRMNYYEEQRDE